MRMRIAAILFPVLLLTLSAQSARELFERARMIEESNNKLPDAIALYAQVTQSSDRQLAATAQLRIGLLHERLGQKDDAQRAFRVVVDRYADQASTTAMARARLAGSASTQPAGGMSSRRVWTFSGAAVFAGTVSHDGRYVPFADWGVQSGNGHLFLRDLMSGASRRLTPDVPETGYVEHAVFSPDDNQLAFNWYNRHFELRIIDVKGSAAARPRVLFSNPEIPRITPHDWSADGKSLAVQLRRKDKTTQIGIVAVKDGSLRVLKSVDWRGASQLFFSPDGRYVAYDLPTGTAEARDVFVLAVDGSREAPAVVHEANDVLVGWTPAGRGLLFTSDRTGRPALWSVPLSEGRPRGAPEQITASGAGPSLGVTRTGALYSLVTHSYFTKVNRSDIHTATFDFGAGRMSPPELAVRTFVGSNNFPSWSPDGEYLAYLRPGNIIMVVQGRDMKPVRELRPALNIYIGGASLRWSPDGKSIAMTATDLKGRQGIFRIDAANGEASPIALSLREEMGAGYRLTEPMWTPDGKRIIYTRVSTGADTRFAALVERELTSGTEREFFRRTAEPSSNPQWMFVELSPNGQSLAAVVNEAWPGRRTGKWNLLLVPVAGGEPRELMRRESRGADVLMWAPDSRSIFVTAIKDGPEDQRRRDVWRVPIDGTAPQQLDLDIDSLGQFFNSDQRMHVHPDGRRVAFAAAEPAKPDEVWMLENFLQAPSTRSQKPLARGKY
jgi:Tol biopolymer transport system component